MSLPALVERILETDDEAKDLIMSQPRDIEDTDEWDDFDWIALVTKTSRDDWERIDTTDDGVMIYGYLPGVTGDDDAWTKTLMVFKDDEDKWHYEIAENGGDAYQPVFVGSYTKLLKLYQQ